MEAASFSPVVQAGLPYPNARSAALNLSLPGPVLCLLESDEDPDVCFKAADAIENASSPTSGSKPSGYRRDSERRDRQYWRLAADPRLETHKKFHENPDCIPYSILRQSPLWSDEEFRKRAAAANYYPTFERPVWDALSHDASQDVRLFLAHNERPVEPPLRKLMADRSPAVAQAALDSYNTHVQNIRKLATCSGPEGDTYRWTLVIHDLLRSGPMTQDSLLDQVVRASVSLPTSRLAKQCWVPASTLGHLAAAPRHHESLRQAIAANPNTPSEILERWASGLSDRTAEGVALSNPGLSTRAIQSFATGYRRNWLGTFQQEALWSNPAIPESLILSKPEGTAATRGIAKNTATPGFVLGKLAAAGSDIGVRCLVARNPSTPASVLVELARASEEDIEYGIGASLLRNPSLPREAVEMLLTHTSMRPRIAASIYTPRDILVQLTSDSDPIVRDAAGCNPMTPESAVLELVDDEAVQSLYTWGDIQRSRSKNLIEHAESMREAEPLPRPESPSEAAAVFLYSMDPESRSKICVRPTLETDFIHRTLANDPHPDVRSAVASWGSDSIRRLILETEENHDVISTLAFSTTDPELTENMVHLQSARLGLIYNVASPPSVLESIALNSSTGGGELLAQHPNASERLLDWLSSAPVSSPRLAALVAQHPNCSTQTLAFLAKHPDDEVRQYVAAASARRPTSHRVLALLAHDKNDLVRSIVGMNRNTPVETLEQLASDGSSEVRQLVACNRRSSDLVWALLAGDKDAKVRLLARSLLTPPTQVRHELAGTAETSPTMLHALAQDTEMAVRLAVVANPSAAPRTVEKLSEDSVPRIRALAAKRTDVPPAVVQRLLRDANWSVRRAAKSAQRRLNRTPS